MTGTDTPGDRDGGDTAGADRRGQVFTLEGLLAALVVLAGVVFALQSVVVTPSTSGTSVAPVQEERLDSVLEQAARDGSLKRAVLAWTGSGFAGATSGEGYYVGTLPSNAFGDALDQTLDGSTIVNVNVTYYDAAGALQYERLVYNGVPGDGSVRSTVTVPVYDWEPPGNFYAPDNYERPSAPGDPDLHCVVQVEVVVWEP